jgi:osmotically-inducible protein OsmY
MFICYKFKEWAPAIHVDVVITDGVAQRWGIVPSERERQALHITAESTPGVRAMEDLVNEMRVGTLAG